MGVLITKSERGVVISERGSWGWGQVGHGVGGTWDCPD